MLLLLAMLSAGLQLLLLLLAPLPMQQQKQPWHARLHQQQKQLLLQPQETALPQLPLLWLQLLLHPFPPCVPPSTYVHLSLCKEHPLPLALSLPLPPHL